jgi:hypothetical protein
MRNHPFLAGIAAEISNLTKHDKELMHAAGIRGLRTGKLHFDQARFLAGEPQGDRFLAIKERMSRLREEGFCFTAITPGPFEMIEKAGVPGSPEYLENYRRMCAFLAAEFEGLVDYWQVANEVDIWIFRATLNLDQSVAFLKAGIRGVQSTGTKAKVGINITLFPSLPGEVDGNTDLHEGVYIAKGIYHDPELTLDYAGFDSYPGTWRKGGAESWDAYLDEFYALTRKPIIIQEFGYSSAGEMMTPEEDASGIYPCKAGKWRFSSKNRGHTPEAQAQFIEESLEIFARKPFVIGATYYQWSDSVRCWQCKQPGCPVETAWGLLDLNHQPKPSYESYKASIRKCFKV